MPDYLAQKDAGTLCQTATSAPTGTASYTPTHLPNLALAEIVFGDVNLDGVTDLFLKPKKIIIIPSDDIAIPIAVPDDTLLLRSKISGADRDYVPVYNPSATATKLANTAGYRAVAADFNGDGISDFLLTVNREKSDHLVVSGRATAPFVDYMQTLNESIIGYDFGASGTTAELRDMNSDGRTDVLIKRDGGYVGVLYADPNGMFSRESETIATQDTTEVVLSEFHAALKQGNQDAALAFITRENRDRYSGVFSALGASDAAKILDSVVDFKPIRIETDYATFGMTRVINGETIVTIVTYHRDSRGVWRIDSL